MLDQNDSFEQEHFDKPGMGLGAELNELEDFENTSNNSNNHNNFITTQTKV